MGYLMGSKKLPHTWNMLHAFTAQPGMIPSTGLEGMKPVFPNAGYK